MKYLVTFCALFLGSFCMIQAQSAMRTIFNESFDTLQNWSKTPDCNNGAIYKVSDGVLTAGTFGKQQDNWFGPIMSKSLNATIDVNLDDFTLSAYLVAKENQSGALGCIRIELVDEDNVPVIGFYWSDNCFEPGTTFSRPVRNPLGVENTSSGNLGMYAGGYVKNATSNLDMISGKVTLKKSFGQFTLHYNDGPALLSYPMTSQKVISKVKIYVQMFHSQYRNASAREMSIDFIKVMKK